MSQQNDNFAKIYFNFYSEILDEWTVELLWAEVINQDKGFYRIDNIPFYAPIATGDIVYASYDDTDKMLTYKKTVSNSGNSTIQVVIMDNSVATKNIRDIFTSLNCKSEKLKEGYFVIEVLANQDYKPIKQTLMGLQDKGIIGYAEPVLSDNHHY